VRMSSSRHTHTHTQTQTQTQTQTHTTEMCILPLFCPIFFTHSLVVSPALHLISLSLSLPLSLFLSLYSSLTWLSPAFHESRVRMNMSPSSIPFHPPQTAILPGPNGTPTTAPCLGCGSKPETLGLLIVLLYGSSTSMLRRAQ
jgi:hypothetical protein